MNNISNQYINLYKNKTNEINIIATNYPDKLKRFSGIKTVIFDVYGTLIISGSGDIGIHDEAEHSQELEKAFSESGFKILKDGFGEIASQKLKDTIINAHNNSKKEGIEFPEIEIRDCWKEVADYLSSNNYIDSSSGDINLLAIENEILSNPVWPMPHLLKTLSALTDKGIKLGIVSNAQFYTPIMLEAFTGKTLGQLGFLPELCVWSYIERIGKPSTVLYEKLVKSANKNFSINPDEILYVGNDMLKDIWACLQTGCRTALFAGDSRSLKLRKDDDRCKHLQPDIAITDLIQILDCI
jgi:putative hydrolase of the HAD superfamily